MVETESNLRYCTLRENNVKEQVEGVVLAATFHFADKLK